MTLADGLDDGWISARAWCRVDFAGGTLDIWPLGLLSPGARTVNVAIDLEARVRLARREAGYLLEQGGRQYSAASPAELCREPETSLVGNTLEFLEAPPLHVILESDSPRGGGLGASSALQVALLRAFERLVDREPLSARRLADVAADLEARLMSLPTGKQDHYPALLGGLLEIVHRPGGERVRQLPVDLASLGDSLTVAYTGQTHFSAGQNWQVVRSRLDGDAESVERFDGIAEVARQTAAAFSAGDFERVGRLMTREWELRRGLAEGVSTPGIENLLEVVKEVGAWGGRACGAGGGGSIAVLAPPERKAAISRALAVAGAEVLDVQPAVGGVELGEA